MLSSPASAAAPPLRSWSISLRHDRLLLFLVDVGLEGTTIEPYAARGFTRFEWLDGAHGTQTTSLCGRNAVQVAPRSPGKLNFEDMARHLEALGEVSYNRFLLKFQADGCEFTVFPDGRAIIKGTADVDRARTLYAKYVGH